MTSLDPDLRALAALDPSPARELTTAEHVRAAAQLDRILAAPAQTPVVRHRRRLLVGAVAVAGVTAVAVVGPSLLPGGASRSTAYASWTAHPSVVPEADRAALAQRCARSWDAAPAGGPSASDVVLAERRGVATLSLVVKGATLVECVDLDPAEPTGWFQLADWPDRAPSPASGSATLETSGAAGDGRLQHSEAIGRLGSAVTGVDVLLPDGSTVQASTGRGWWAAWWPGGEGAQLDGLRVRVHAASGSTTTPASSLLPAGS
ncbi:hypothetical protein EV189_2479 [Motilibacter rhizosphaerae]|uniref:Uncharacterized protein n=1 Tax=Motilibacter rhizosphaerae TaxID=598652 RepID=A0A4V2F4B8_9ACTN|nr:hypothetical protein [Motilibacter rhizosphaerae]RZS87057.1 hypothetical protein EV189_2479 [Motilibacter rhizosphaerae]